MVSAGVAGNLATGLIARLDAAGDRVAVIDASGRATRASDLLGQVAAFRRMLRARGVAPGDRVLLQVPNGPALAACIIGALASGAVPILADPALGDAVYTRQIAVAAPRLLVVHPLVAALGRLGPVRRRLRARDVPIPPAPRGSPAMTTLVLSRRWLALRGRQTRDGVPPVAVRDADDALLVFTGGTTDDPRGVRWSHGGLRAFLDDVEAAAGDLTFDAMLADTPQQLLYGVHLGRTVRVARARKARRVADARALFASGEVGAYFGAPWLWQAILDQLHDEAAGRPIARFPPSLRAVLLGGAPVSAAFLERLSAALDPATEVVVLYGLTEAGPVCRVSGAAKRAWRGGGDLVGAPLPAVDVAIDAPDVAGVGEVLVGGRALYTGYLGQPERRPDESLRTGDLGRLVDRDGARCLVLEGRVKDMILRHGTNIYPPTVEGLIEALAGPRGAYVRRCAMVGAWSEARADEDVVLFVEPGPGWDARAFEAAVAEVVGPAARPDRIVVRDPLPVAGRQSKVDKARLRALAGEGA